MTVTVKMDKTIDKFIRKRGLLGQAGGYEAPAVYGSPPFDRGKYRQDRIVRRDIALANGVSLRYPGFLIHSIYSNKPRWGRVPLSVLSSSWWRWWWWWTRGGFFFLKMTEYRRVIWARVFCDLYVALLLILLVLLFFFLSSFAVLVILKLEWTFTQLIISFVKSDAFKIVFIVQNYSLISGFKWGKTN